MTVVMHRHTTCSFFADVQPIPKLRPKQAFTLIELLVVIAIIAILASLAVSGLTRAKAMSRNTVCQSNLRQLGLGVSFYLDAQGVYPAYGQWASNTKYESLLNLISPYLGKPIPPLSSPANGVMSGIITSADPLGGAPYHCSEKSQWKPRNFDYGYNTWGADLSNGRIHFLGLQGGIKESRVLKPADMVALGDTEAYSDGWPGPVVAIGPYDGRESRGLVSRVGSQHRGKANVLFCDLHLESNLQQLWFAPTEEARRRWNSDNEPHPELWPPKN